MARVRQPACRRACSSLSVPFRESHHSIGVRVRNRSIACFAASAAAIRCSPNTGSGDCDFSSEHSAFRLITHVGGVLSDLLILDQLVIYNILVFFCLFRCGCCWRVYSAEYHQCSVCTSSEAHCSMHARACALRKSGLILIICSRAQVLKPSCACCTRLS